MDPDLPRWTQMAQMDTNGPRWTNIDTYGPRWTHMDSYGPRWIGQTAGITTQGVRQGICETCLSGSCWSLLVPLTSFVWGLRLASARLSSLRVTSIHFGSLRLTSVHFGSLTSAHSLRLTSAHFGSLRLSSAYFGSLRLVWLSFHFEGDKAGRLVTKLSKSGADGASG